MIAFLIILSSLVLLLLLGGFYAYHQAFYRGGSKKNVKEYFDKNETFQSSLEQIKLMIADIDSCHSEDVYIKSYDGTLLYAQYFHLGDNFPVQILMHGYKGNAKRDMCGGHMLARQLKHNILLIHQRGCGKSGGKTISFGVKERLDALCWARYVTDRFGNVPIFLVGVSLGGAVALMATDTDLPKNVVGVIADCPYSSPKDIIAKVCTDRGMPKLIYPIVTLGALVFGRFNPNKEGAVKSVKNSRVPILILHGEKDGFVPVSMAWEIYESATCQKQIFIFENADHGTCYMSDPERYEHAVADFIKYCLKSRPSVDNL